MADRITQLQQAIHLLSEHFYNSVGLLQQIAGSVNDPSTGRSERNQEASQLAVEFSDKISRTSYDIYTIIDSLPTRELTPEVQSQRRLEAIDRNDLIAQQLKSSVIEGKAMLVKIRNAQKRISDLELDMLKEV